jgi:hypothetical protein
LRGGAFGENAQRIPQTRRSRRCVIDTDMTEKGVI